MKGRHTTLDKALKPSIAWLENVPHVKKIVLGLSESCRHKYAPGFIKIRRDVDGGILINGYSGKGVTRIFVGISPIEKRDEVKAAIEKRFTN